MIIRTRGHRLEGIWHSGSPMAGIINLVRGGWGWVSDITDLQNEVIVAALVLRREPFDVDLDVRLHRLRVPAVVLHRPGNPPELAANESAVAPAVATVEWTAHAFTLAAGGVLSGTVSGPEGNVDAGRVTLSGTPGGAAMPGQCVSVNTVGSN